MKRVRDIDRTKRPRPRTGASGRFVLRIESGLHQALRAAAREGGLSLNDYCARRLAAPASGSEAGDAASTLRRAAFLFGDALVGVVAFGSWVRGEAGATSDVDLLVVVDGRVPLTRELYRRWDEVPVSWDGREAEPHFVHLPDPGMVTGGVWAEAAIDGVVLFERRLSLSQQLAAVRRHILSGRLVRRRVHGQPYWAEVA
jgi:predicted nucleotidyltransferase